MWVWFHPLFLLVLANIALCAEKGSLSFVIDNTLSMTDDISQVKQSADAITKIVFEEKSSQIKNMVLVTVNDPKIKFELSTEDRNTFKRAINGLYVHNKYGNWDCPEMSMAGILEALDKSLPRSFIYVFTDASAKDHHRSDEVKNLCQKKQSQIVFVLTGFCYNTQEKGFQVYYDIAAACSGLAFYVRKHQVNQVLNIIQESIKDNKTMITGVKTEAGVFTDVPFVIDEQTEYAIVTASGVDVSLIVWGPHAQQSRLMWINNAKVLKLSDPTPGTYTARVRGTTATSVYIVGRTDFIFAHGFSELEPKTLNDTTPQPIANTQTRLSISVSDEKHTVDIISAQILDMNEHVVIPDLPLTLINKDFYTTPPFQAPSFRFKVAVNGKAIRTGKYIKRIAKIPVTPQEPPKILPKSKSPVVTISEGSLTKVDYGKSVKLTCKVTAYPEPVIKWVNIRGVTMKSQSSVVELPYEYISYLTLPDVTSNDRYTCSATNDLGTGSSAVEVVIRHPFVVKPTLKDLTELQYGTRANLVCDIRAPLSMRISWSFLPKDGRGGSRLLANSDKYSLSANNTVLTFNRVDLNEEGTYTCKATLDRDPNIFVTNSTRVRIGGLSLPQVSGVRETIAHRGSNVEVECRSSGIPTPTITWLFMGEGSSKYAPTSGSGSVLRITNVDVTHAGRYKCVAHNAVGDAEHITTLIVQFPPTFVSSSRDVYQSVEGRDAQLKLHCAASGLPKPIITWKMGDVTITPSAKYSINDGTLTINEPKISDTQIYTCEAKNAAGSVQATFRANILQKPAVSGDKTVTVQKGNIANIKCNIAKGVPKPAISWLFMGEGSSNYAPTSGSDSVLRIANVDVTHAGRYKCVAHNTVGDAVHITTLIVEYVPVITSKSSTYKALQGDAALRIPCDAVGVPQPSFNWKKNGEDIKLSGRYSISNGTLVIKNVTLSDTGSYTCEVTNYMGSTKATFQVQVDECLDNMKVDTVKYVHLLEGASQKLTCGVGEPNHSVRWFRHCVYNEPERRKYRSISRCKEWPEIETYGQHYDLNNVTEFPACNYTCRASDVQGAHSQTFVVVIGYPPKFRSQLLKPTFDWTGTSSVNDQLKCDVDAKPTPDFVWTYNGKVLSEHKSSRLDVMGNWGNYTCTVSNIHGAVDRSFLVTSSQCLVARSINRYISNMPLMLSLALTWPELNSNTNYLMVQSGQKLTLSCPDHKDQKNFLQKIPTSNTIVAECVNEDKFAVKGNTYRYSELQCAHEVTPLAVEKAVKCLTDTSQLIRVGFSVGRFVEAYEVCFDVSKNMPLYTRMLMSKSNGVESVSHSWHKYPAGGSDDRAYTCHKSKQCDCYTKQQLVNARDFSDGAPQNSTFRDALNAIPYWLPCSQQKSPWEEIEDNVRSQFDMYSAFIAWSGTHELRADGGDAIPRPRYLWKVLSFEDVVDSVAIVYVNGPSPTNKDILCEDVCEDVGWIEKTSDHVYCCRIDDFLKAFGLNGTTVGESMYDAAQKILSN